MVRLEMVDGEPVVICAEGTIPLRQWLSTRFQAGATRAPGPMPQEAARALA